jgi:uncharacterized membrane protein (TIGR02234 family)
VLVGGWWTVRHGHRWPAMGARYERPAGAANPDHARPDHARPDHARPAQDGVDQTGVDTRVAWDALDRGEDPTAT